MEKGKYPIIANGELYVEPISKKMNFPLKNVRYNDAKILLRELISEDRRQEELFLDEASVLQIGKSYVQIL